MEKINLLFGLFIRFILIILFCFPMINGKHEDQCVIYTYSNYTCKPFEKLESSYAKRMESVSYNKRISISTRRKISSSKNFLHEENNRSLFIGKNLVNQPLIVVLIWTKYHKASPLTLVEDWEHKISEAITNCPVRCKFIADRTLLKQSNAVVFHSVDIDKDDFPPFHDPQQMWIFLEEESPQKSRWDLKEVPNVFNWTMTYRSDSDIHHPYGQVLRVNRRHSQMQPLLTHEMKKFLLGKPKLVAWTASNCLTSSKREQLVLELRKFIRPFKKSVDVFGRCGFEKHECLRDWPDGCLSHIERNYKFYLAFENSLCSQYVSEKFFNALSRNIVPIVYGFENYSKLAPPNSFIDSRKFATPEDLAKYLIHLDNNPKEYLKYFEWKNYFKVVPKGVGWCRLCHKLKANVEHPKNIKNHWYQDIFKWWYYYKGDLDNVASHDTSTFHFVTSKKHQTSLSETDILNQPNPACVEPLDFYT